MRNFCIIFAVLALSTLTAYAAADPNAPIDPAKYDHIIKLACVGDSITEGVGTSHHKRTSWPAVLGLMLGEKWSVGNFGVSGRTLLNHGDLPYQTKDAFKKAQEFPPDVVVIMLGTNDTKPQNWKFKNEFIADYKDLIEKFQKLPTPPRIFICHPPLVVADGLGGINEPNILAEIPMIDQVASDEKTGIIDIHAATLNHPELFPDHVHPHDEGAVLIAKTIFKSLTCSDFIGPIPTSEPAAN
jgi:lysophospholipase L1-like esterase